MWGAFKRWRARYSEQRRRELEELNKKLGIMAPYHNPKYPNRKYFTEYYYFHGDGIRLDTDRLPELVAKFRKDYPELFDPKNRDRKYDF